MAWVDDLEAAFEKSNHLDKERDQIAHKHEDRNMAEYEACSDTATPECDNDPISPNHYTKMNMAPSEYIILNEGEFTWCIANVIKYVSRYKRKNGIEDLKKARWYLERQIAMEEETLKH